MTDEEREGLQRRAQVRDIVTSWVLALWGLVAGLYLTFGGVEYAASPAYSYALSLFGDRNAIGSTLLAAAVVNIVAIVVNSTTGIAIGTSLVGIWLWAMAICMAMATLQVPDGSNMEWLTSGCLGICYFIRAYNKIRPPRPQDIKGLISLAAMWFV